MLLTKKTYSSFFNVNRLGNAIMKNYALPGVKDEKITSNKPFKSFFLCFTYRANFWWIFSCTEIATNLATPDWITNN